MEQLRWVVLQYPGGAKSLPVLQFSTRGTRYDEGLGMAVSVIEWQNVPTEIIQVDDKGTPITETNDDQDERPTDS